MSISALDPLLTDKSVDPESLFQVVSKLGEGSYGAVYKGLDTRDGSVVAIKVLASEGDNADLEGLVAEIQILRDCDSPYIVAYKGAFQKDGNVWIVMEYCGAGSLADLMIICEQCYTEGQIAVVMKMSLHGLKYLHGQKKIHRDIKAGNVLINHEGECKLADFGVSAELANTMSKRQTVIGTPYWMAPEVLQSTKYDFSADIWSLAITAYELAVGEPPNSDLHPMKAILEIPKRDPPTLPDDQEWSSEFEDFLHVCLQQNPQNRPSAEQLLQHVFITGAPSKAVISDLVDKCMQEIDEFREAQTEYEDEGEGEDSPNAITTPLGTIKRSSNEKEEIKGEESEGESDAKPESLSEENPIVLSASGNFLTIGGGVAKTMVRKETTGKEAKTQKVLNLEVKLQVLAGQKEQLKKKQELEGGLTAERQEQLRQLRREIMRSATEIMNLKKEILNDPTISPSQAVRTRSGSTGASGPTLIGTLASKKGTTRPLYKTNEGLPVDADSSAGELKAMLLTLDEAKRQEERQLEAVYKKHRMQVIGWLANPKHFQL